MKKFTKLLAIPLCFLIVGTATSCSPPPREIALITGIGDVNDGSFNQESWEAIREYASKNHKSYDRYRSFNDSNFARECAIKQAVAKGAKIVILPGFDFEESAIKMQNKFPNTHFFLIDSPIAEIPKSNLCCIVFKIEISGFLAGYSVATDYLKYDYKHSGGSSIKSEYSLGYCGGLPTDGCYQFGYGYIQGIAHAFSDFVTSHNGLKMPTIHVPFMYSKVFAQDDKTAAALKGWYAEGVKTVFACGGKLYQSVTEALNDFNKKHEYANYVDWDIGKAPREAARWIGVDSDQYKTLKYPYEKQSIITSALKGIKQSIIDALDFHFAGRWSEIGGPRGEGKENWRWSLGLNTRFGRSDDIEPKDYVGIASDDFNRETKVIRGFNNFTHVEFEDIKSRLSSSEEDKIEVYGNEEIKEIKGEKTYFAYHLSGKDRTETDQGVPDKMTEWVKDDGTAFNDKYLCDLNNTELDIDVR